LKQLFLIRNQNLHYLGKNGEWLDGSHASALFRCEHRDVAVNQLIEINIKDFDLRGEIILCDSDDRGHPVVEVLNPVVVMEEAAPEDPDAAQQSEIQQST
jgi:hypothetical protein